MKDDAQHYSSGGGKVLTSMVRDNEGCDTEGREDERKPLVEYHYDRWVILQVDFCRWKNYSHYRGLYIYLGAGYISPLWSPRNTLLTIDLRNKISPDVPL